MKLLLAVIYGSPRRHSNSSKIFKKIGKIEINFYDHFRTSWSLIRCAKRVKRWTGPAGPGSTITFFDGLFFGQYKKRRTWNFDTIVNQVFNLCYQNLRSISLIVWKLSIFRERIAISVIFSIFFTITFDRNL